MIARTAGGLCLVAVPGLVLLSLLDAPASVLAVVGIVPFLAVLAVAAATWTATPRSI